MKRIVIIAAAASFLASGVSFAGLNPEFPMLPTALVGTYDIANNQGSSMCVDCHSAVPQTTGGSHFVYNFANDTRSSGGWSTADTNYATANARFTADDGKYFQYKVTSDWGTGRYSKYYNGTNSVIITGAAADIGDASLATAPPMTAAADYQTTIAGGTDPTGYQLICESCHNILNNVAGGNNLLAPLSSNADWSAADATEATLCVGCHGFMYSASGAAYSDVNYGNGRNTTDGTVRRGNAESHTINGTTYDMNHHVMIGDQINLAKISAGYAWRDVTSFAGTAHAANAETSDGQYPVNGAWTDLKDAVKPTTATNAINCLSCHGPGHGNQGGTLMSDISSGASILLDTTISDTPASDNTNALTRIGEGVRGWMSFDDGLYCNNCHHLPGNNPADGTPWEAADNAL